jgi:hypothetical protein
MSSYPISPINPNLQISLPYTEENDRYHPPIEKPQAKPKKYSTDLTGLAQTTLKKSGKIWGYLNKFIMVTRHTLNITLMAGHEFIVGGEAGAIRIANAISHLKMFSIIGLLFTVASIPDAVKNVFKSMQLSDKIGIFLSGLAITLIVGDILETITNIVNTALTLASQISIPILAAIGAPLGFILVGLNTFTRIFQLIKTAFLFRKFNQEVIHKVTPKKLTNPEIYQVLWKFLDNNLGLVDKQKEVLEKLFSNIEKMTPEEAEKEIEKAQKEIHQIMELKKAEMIRASSPEIVEKFEGILNLLKQKQEISDKEVKNMMTDLNKISSLFKQKVFVDIGNLIANAITIIALCLLVTGAPALIGIILLLVALLIRLGLELYKDFA